MAVGTRRGQERLGFGQNRHGGPNPRIVSAPNVIFSTGGAEALGQLAGNLGMLSSKFHQRYDAAVSAQAQIEGARDGLSGNIAPVDLSTTRGAAYFEAATSTMQANVAANSAVAMNDIYRANRTNPEGIKASLEAYSSGVFEQLNAVSPAMAAAYRQRFVTQALPMINQTIENREALIVQQRKVALDAAETAQDAMVAQRAEQVFSEDPAKAIPAQKALGATHAMKVQHVSEMQAEDFLVTRLVDGKDRLHVAGMTGSLKTRLAAMFAAAPPEIAAGLGIFSGYRSVAHQERLYNAAVAKHGTETSARRWVAPPGKSNHNFGNASDLAYNGQSLAHAPETVKNWVHKNAERFGLKFPLGNEPWHVEVAETRGGKAFKGLGDQQAGETGSSAYDQKFYDQVFSTGFKSWFRRQENKAELYTQFMEGELQVPMWAPDGTHGTINLRDRLSPPALEALEKDIREDLRFENETMDRRERDQKEEAEKVSNELRFDLLTRAAFPGQKDPDGNTLAPPSIDEVVTAVKANKLSAGDGEKILEVLQKGAAETTDRQVFNEALRRVNNGEDIRSFVFENIGRLRKEDATQLLNTNHSRVISQEGALSPNQQFYLNNIKDALTPDGFMATIDQFAEERKFNAMDEYRRRVLEGEPADVVSREIIERARVSAENATASMLDSLLQPRFSVPSGTGRQIDVAASANALVAARKEGRISEASFKRQVALLRQWDGLQKRIAQPAPAEKGKK